MKDAVIATATSEQEEAVLKALKEVIEERKK